MLKPLAIALATLLLASTGVLAVRIDDLTRLRGERTNTLIGKGLVIGLKGTGDGGKNPEMTQMLGQMLARMGNAVTPAELKDTKNVAVVLVTVTLPEHGVRDGEKIDVHLASTGAAQSLKGGRLFITSLFDQDYRPYIARVRDANGKVHEQAMPFAIAQGPVVLEDATNPLAGVVRNGATMEVDLPSEQIDRAGRVTLTINDPSAGWTTANAIATAVNSEYAGEGNGRDIATAIDPKNVVVQIPPEYRGQPDAFIANMQRTEVTLRGGEARVIINDRTGTMILTGDVEISPVIVSHRGLTISTLTPEPKPTDEAPIIRQSEFAAIASDKTKTPAGGNGRLQDLLDALDQLKVPAEDKIAIVKQLYEIGKLHARLIVE